MGIELDGKSWPFSVWSGVLAPEHYAAMDETIWTFLWCIDATTVQTEYPDGERVGFIRGKEPVTLRAIAKETGISKSTVNRHLDLLAEEGYISQEVERSGRVIVVRRSKKLWLRPKNSMGRPPKQMKCPHCGQLVHIPWITR
ncbi:MAG: helix-turn-helix domain-containing protein [Candidatus Eisenbacteria sp.]|nr:helix-turn-helix domain-containing protein [Candidatus Eisenbacteria bacterium]